ncbi:hypothetical protein CM49_06442 [Paenibacillus sp. P1XP2]|nr:hypothetical protein CM49_06442 [Paenibacillus sp. P1XP2]
MKLLNFLKISILFSIFITISFFTMEKSTYAFGISNNIIIHDNNSFEITGLLHEVKIEKKEITVMIVTGETTDPSRWIILNKETTPVDELGMYSLSTQAFSKNDVINNKIALVLQYDDMPPILYWYIFPFIESERVLKQFDPLKVTGVKNQTASEAPLSSENAKESFTLDNNIDLKPVWTYTSPSNFKPRYPEQYLEDTTLISSPVVREYANGKKILYNLMQEAVTNSKGKEGFYSFRLLALDDNTGKKKWIYTKIPENAYASVSYDVNPYRFGNKGEVYFYIRTNLYALNSDGKQKWVKPLKNVREVYPQPNGKVYISQHDKGESLLLIDSNGKDLLRRNYGQGKILFIKDDYVLVSTPYSVDLFKISASKKIFGINTEEYYLNTNRPFEILSDGTFIVPIHDRDNEMWKIIGISPEGSRKWTRYFSDKDFNLASYGNYYIVQEKNTITLFGSNNKLIVKRDFNEFKNQVSLQISNDGTIVFGTIYHPDGTSKGSGLYYLLNPKNLKTIHSIRVENTELNALNFNFKDKDTLYLIDLIEGNIHKYLLKK